MKKIKMGYKTRKPWLSPGLKESIKLKNKLYIKHKRYPTTNSESIYKRYRNQLTSILTKAEKDHYDKLFISYKSNMKKSWELITEIINRKQSRRKTKFLDDQGEPLSDKTVANNFNNFFSECGDISC